MKRLTLVVSRKDAGRRLGDYLRNPMGCSKRLVSRLKNEPHGIMVNGLQVTVRHVLAAGDRVSIAQGPVRPLTMPVEMGPLEIIYEDDFLLAINKPPQTAMYPRYRARRGRFPARSWGIWRTMESRLAIFLITGWTEIPPGWWSLPSRLGQPRGWPGNRPGRFMQRKPSDKCRQPVA